MGKGGGVRLRWRKFGENNSIYHLADFSRGRAGKLLHGRRYKNRTNSEACGRRRDATVPCWNMHIFFHITNTLCVSVQKQHRPFQRSVDLASGCVRNGGAKRDRSTKTGFPFFRPKKDWEETLRFSFLGWVVLGERLEIRLFCFLCSDPKIFEWRFIANFWKLRMFLTPWDCKFILTWV